MTRKNRDLKPVRNNYATPEQGSDSRTGVVVAVTMSHPMLELLNSLATANGCTRSQFIRKLMMAELSKDDAKLARPGDSYAKDRESYDIVDRIKQHQMNNRAPDDTQVEQQ